MKTLITTIFLMSAIWSQAQTWSTATLSAKMRRVEKTMMADSIRINTLVTQNNSQQSQINSLLSLTASQGTDITNLNGIVIKQSGQIKALQDSLNSIPYMKIDTAKNNGYPSLSFINNILKIIQ